MPADRRDPICGMRGTIERHGWWFCSDACAAEFLKRKADTKTRRRYPFLDPWIWVPVSGVALATIGLVWPAAGPVSAGYLAYIRKVLLPFLLGLLIGGVIDHFIPHEYIVKLLSGPRKRVIARATFLGFLASTCSHGVLALTMELFRKGASVPAVISFLLASPWASMALTFLLLSLFGPPGLLFIAGALGIAALTGLIFQRLDRRGLLDANPATVPVQEFSIRKDLQARLRAYPWTADQLRMDVRGIVHGMLPLGRMTLGWVQLGLVLGSVLGLWVPHHVFEQWMGPTPAGLACTLGAASIIEVCSEGTAPLAYELFRHTGALGNAFAFLMAGVITDYTELAAVWTTIGRRTVLWLLAVALPLVFGLGLILNLLRVS